MRHVQEIWPERKDENQNSDIVRKVWEKKLLRMEEISRFRCCKEERQMRQNYWV